LKLVFTIAYFAGVVLENVIRAPYARKRGKIGTTDRRINLSELAVGIVMALASFVLPLVYALTKWLDFADYGLGGPATVVLGAVGIAVMSAAIWVFWRAHHDLGAYWSPSLEIGEDQHLVTQGIYASIRHPMYASLLLWGLAQPLLLQNWIVGPASLVAFLVCYLVRVPREEAMMLDHFGDEYRTYIARTGGVIPPVLTGHR
jgi:protein-S-isoprenylcysteine O-methyltransferase Ste14